MCVLPVSVEVVEAQQAGKLLQTAAVDLQQTWQQRCDSCPKTKSESESERVGGEVEEEVELPPSEPLETYPTAT